jgi:exodeoxyribonuclease VII large subunit
LAALEQSGLLEVNRRLLLPELPLRLGLVTSQGSAAYHDFLSTLQESGYGFQVYFVHASVQGTSAEGELVSALATLATLRPAGKPLDCLVLTRGGGARSDLAVFDSRVLAETAARLPLPVLTGLGHEIDQSITDLVSHTALKTPTKVAEFLVQRVQTADDAVQAFHETICRQALDRLRLAEEALRHSESAAKHATLRLAAAGQRVQNTARALDLLSRRKMAEASRRGQEVRRRLLLAAPRLLQRQKERPAPLLQRLLQVARGRLRINQAVLDGKSRLCRELAPERLLKRGFSITRDASGGILKDPDVARVGDPITTQLSGGTLQSRVEKP